MTLEWIVENARALGDGSAGNGNAEDDNTEDGSDESDSECAYSEIIGSIQKIISVLFVSASKIASTSTERERRA
jgi:hypothetical protein